MVKIRTIHTVFLATGLSVLASVVGANPAAANPTQELLTTLNSDDTVRGSESTKAWRLLFDAFLELSDPPQKVGSRFNLTTIWPGMPGWSDTAAWAQANPGMTTAALDASQRVIIGLPYGVDQVPGTYAARGLCIAIDIEEGQRVLEFQYLPALKTIAAFLTAEAYRRFESGDVDGGLEVAMAQLNIMRMFCDRQFLEEKLATTLLLTESLANTRDYFWTYQDKISADQFGHIALRELPYLRPDRARLLIPENDRIVAEAVLREVFDEQTGSPIPARFEAVFTNIQSSKEPLTRLGAARRWREIAMGHAGLPASQERLTLIYDDWWRRWRLREYGELISRSSEFDMTNEMRYAGVLISIENIQQLFTIRNNLRVAVYGTAISAGLCAFKRENGSYPTPVDNKAMRLYGTYVPKKLDADPYYYRDDLDGLDGFRYRLLTSRTTLDVGTDRLEVGAGEALLYSLGENLEDDLGAEHVADGSEQDIVLWPPVKPLLRTAGFLK